MPDDAALTTAGVVGRNCKRLRLAAGLTQDAFAQHARLVGLRWTAASVGDFEAGRSAPAFATVLAVVLALQNATGKDVTLAELVAGDGYVALTGGIDVKVTALADVCRGGPARLPNGSWRAKTRSASAAEIQALAGGDVGKVLGRSGIAEVRAAQRLGVSPARLAAVSAVLWGGRTFSEERNRRAGPDANSQNRGQVSRTMQAELERAISDGNDQ